jgi:hypothetical protein
MQTPRIHRTVQCGRVPKKADAKFMEESMLQCNSRVRLRVSARAVIATRLAAMGCRIETREEQTQ